MTEDSARHAWRLMRTLMFEVHEGRHEVAETLQMSYIRAKALMRLASGPRTMRELAAKLSTDAPYTSVVIDDLERRGLVERRPHPDDRRVKIVSITPAGAAAAAIAERIQSQPPAAFDKLGAADAATLERILSQLVSDS